jgi:DNA-binding CsgD family transcriptional regulator
MALVQQNEFLQSLRNELLRLSGNVDSHIQSPLKDIARRLKKQSQAQEEWSAFEEQFQLIHADFIHRLSDKFPTLSPTELKVCALLRIGLSSKEISLLLCVTLRCVETHRYRIRKKMSAGSKKNLILMFNAI